MADVLSDTAAFEQLQQQADAAVGRTGRSQGDFTRARELTPEVAAQIDDAFEYHPWDPNQQRAGTMIREALADAVKALIHWAPPSPDRSAAIRKIREARMDANSAITHGGRY